jgi:hypothetical protein
MNKGIKVFSVANVGLVSVAADQTLLTIKGGDVPCV